MDGEVAPPEIVLDVGRGVRLEGRGVVHEDGEGAERLRRPTDERRALRGRREVGLERRRSSSGRFYAGHEVGGGRGTAAVVDQNGVSFGSKGKRHRSAQPAGRSRDQSRADLIRLGRHEALKIGVRRATRKAFGGRGGQSAFGE